MHTTSSTYNLTNTTFNTLNGTVHLHDYNSDYYDYEDYASLDSIDYSQIPYQAELEPLKPWWEFMIKIIFYLLTIILALVGNVLVILIVFRNKRMRTTTNYYIVNLSISDILVTMCCSWVHLVNDLSSQWPLGWLFCKINSFAQVLSLVSSILTLTLIACDRFFGIVFAMKAHVVEVRARYSIIIVWLCSLGVAAPLIPFRTLNVRTWMNYTEVWCGDQWPVERVQGAFASNRTPSKDIYYTCISVVLYIMPIIVMTVAYTVIIVKLRMTRAPGEQVTVESTQEKVKRRVIIMLIVILGLFTLCWLPFHVTILYDIYRTDKHTELGSWYGKLQYAALYLGYSNSAFNPVAYAGFNENFRRGFKTLLRCRPVRRYSSVASRQDSFQSTTLVTKV